MLPSRSFLELIKVLDRQFLSLLTTNHKRRGDSSNQHELIGLEDISCGGDLRVIHSTTQIGLPKIKLCPQTSVHEPRELQLMYDIHSLRKPPWPGARKSKILEILGHEQFEEVPCCFTPGTVVWCNFELARELGFSVPENNILDAVLESQLLTSCSFRSVPFGEICEQAITTLYADRYGGAGMGGNLGSARGAFLPYGDLFVKGIGRTPLFREISGETLNSHGNMHMWHGLYEATLTEVCANLFSKIPARILCLIDQGGNTTYPDGRTHERAILVRAGNQLRPAHVSVPGSRGKRAQAHVFIDITRSTRQLVHCSTDSKATPLLQKTMLRVIHDQARAAAQHARWRLTHASLSASNTQMDGGPLDLVQARTNPRSVPLKPEYGLGPNVVPRGDYQDRVAGLYETYHAVRRSLDAQERERLQGGSLEIEEVFDEAFFECLEVELVCAAGIKREVAERLQHQDRHAVSEFALCLIELSDLKNPDADTETRRYDERAAVVDIFGLLGDLPPVHFTQGISNTEDFVFERLRPVITGNPELKKQTSRRLKSLMRRFTRAYSDIMLSCEECIGTYWSDRKNMEASISARSAFTNRPIEKLMYEQRSKTFQTAATRYRKEKCFRAVRQLVDSTIADSYRDVDDMLLRGTRTRRLRNDGVETQIQTLGGVRYSVCSWITPAKQPQVRVEFSATTLGNNMVLALEQHIQMPKEKFRALKFRWSTDSWLSESFASGDVSEFPDGSSSSRLRFELPVAKTYGVLAGCLFDAESDLLNSNSNPPAEYAYACPDIEETTQAYISSKHGYDEL